MVFASSIFLSWFLPLFLLVYWPLPLRWKNVWLTVASYGFFAWWRPDLSSLMLLTTVVDWWCGRRMAQHAARGPRRLWLLVSVLSNLLLLGWFKYANLVVDSLNWWLSVRGHDPLPWEKVILPIGISFYTFQSMSYTIDLYRGQVQPARSLLDFACYVAMFPQLVAGPIVRYADVAREVNQRRHDWREMAAGMMLLMLGLAKKVLLADNAARLADAVFAQAQDRTPGLLSAWTGMLAYALQIYFDFSGYSDMAIGLGTLIGFHFLPNFDSPYQAESITGFWRRWHMSLSTWLRDYLYIPLGGNRHGRLRTYVNLMLTMLLGGLWHGAAWTFVIWGAWHGGLLALERLLGGAPWRWLPRPGRVLCTFVVVVLGWTVFRAPDMAVLGRMLVGLGGGAGLGAAPTVLVGTKDAYAALALGSAIAFLLPNSGRVVLRFHPLAVVGSAAAFLLAVCHLLATDYSPFLYFQF